MKSPLRIPGSLGSGSVITVMCGLVFLTLLAFRLDLFQSDPPLSEPGPTTLAARESWMNIFQKGQRIGYAHRRLTPLEGGYDLYDTTRIRINTMGLAQDITFQTTGRLRSDLSLDSFRFNLKSSQFNFTVEGSRSGDTLRVLTGNQSIDIPVKDGLFLASGTLDAALDTDLKLNETRRFTIFDPATMGHRPVDVTLVGSEVIEIMGRKHLARKMRIQFMGTAQHAWVGEDGSVLQEDGLLGIRLQRATREEALRGSPLTAGPDLTELASILPKGRPQTPYESTRLRARITGLTDSIQLSGGRQRYENGVLTIMREGSAAPSVSEPVGPADRLSATPLIQSDHSKIRSLVSRIVSPADIPMVRARKIMEWIDENIAKRPVISVPNALETLENRMGDCNEHAVLMAAMARAAGIPSQIEAGLVFTRERFYYHAWNSLYLLGRWTTVDALMGQIPADVTHIRLVRGEAESQIDLMGVIGKLEIEILEPPT